MFSEGLPLGIQKISRFGFDPDDAILEVLLLTHNEFGCEQALRGKHNSAPVFYDTQILLPERLQWYHTIPIITGGAIREIAQNHIHRFVRQCGQHIQTVALNQRITKGVQR